MKRAIIIYYSQAQGNTRRIAEMVQAATGADIAQIDTAVPYTGTQDEISNQGLDEVNRKYTPEIKPLSINLADYDTIILGTPTWWYTVASAVLTFLTENDLSGKTVIPFQTHAGWPGHTMKDIRKLCAGATVKNELAIQFDSSGGNQLETSMSEINAWIEEINSIIS